MCCSWRRPINTTGRREVINSVFSAGPLLPVQVNHRCYHKKPGVTSSFLLRSLAVPRPLLGHAGTPSWAGEIQVTGQDRRATNVQLTMVIDGQRRYVRTPKPKLASEAA